METTPLLIVAATNVLHNGNGYPTIIHPGSNKHIKIGLGVIGSSLYGYRAVVVAESMWRLTLIVRPINNDHLSRVFIEFPFVSRAVVVAYAVHPRNSIAVLPFSERFSAQRGPLEPR
jgi:hypothetical protein